jgi:hypothetical protein
MPWTVFEKIEQFDSLPFPSAIQATIYSVEDRMLLRHPDRKPKWISPGVPPLEYVDVLATVFDSECARDLAELTVPRLQQAGFRDVAVKLSTWLRYVKLGCVAQADAIWDSELAAALFDAKTPKADGGAMAEIGPVGPNAKTPASSTDQSLIANAREKRRDWKPPEGYVGLHDFGVKRGISRSTIGGWQERHETKTFKDPQSGQVYAPQEWVDDRMKSYKPKPRTES